MPLQRLKPLLETFATQEGQLISHPPPDDVLVLEKAGLIRPDTSLVLTEKESFAKWLLTPAGREFLNISPVITLSPESGVLH